MTETEHNQFPGLLRDAILKQMNNRREYSDMCGGLADCEHGAGQFLAESPEVIVWLHDAVAIMTYWSVLLREGGTITTRTPGGETHVIVGETP